MAFFDGLGKKITDTVDVVGKKTNEVVEIQKLRGQISSLEKNMDRATKSWADLFLKNIRTAKCSRRRNVQSVRRLREMQY